MEFLNRHKRAFIISLVVVCIVAIVATINYRFRPTFLDNALGYVLTPMQTTATSASRWVSSKFASSDDVQAVEAENKKLKETVDLLTSENKRLKLVEQESKKLTELLQINDKYPDLPKVGAETIAKDTSNWFETYIINKGTQDGFTEDLVVLASGGLVGRIIKASFTSSEVISIIDEKNFVSVKCLRSGDFGFVRGDMMLMKEGLCRLDFVSIDADLMENDELITSHLGDIYPPGITVGYVKEVKQDPNTLTKYAIVQPAVDFQNIETVLVVTEKYNQFPTVPSEE